MPSAARPSSPRACVRSCRKARLDAGCHHLVLISAPDVSRDELVAYLTADRDEARRAAREEALDADDAFRHRWGEVSVQEMTVVDVHGRGSARGERGDPPDDARLGRMGLDDVRAERADLGRHPRQGLGIGEHVRRPAQPVDAGDRERPRAQLELVGLVRSDLTGQQPLFEPCRIQVVHQVSHDAGRSPDVHPRDHAQDANGGCHGSAR